jgi:hypothetical protein
VTRARLRVEHLRRGCGFVRLAAPALVMFLLHAPVSQFLAHEEMLGASVRICVNSDPSSSRPSLGLSLGTDVRSDYVAKGLDGHER